MSEEAKPTGNWSGPVAVAAAIIFGMPQFVEEIAWSLESSSLSEYGGRLMSRKGETSAWGATGHFKISR